MPSIVAMGISAAFDLPARAHVVDQGAESVEAQLRVVAVGFGLGVDPLLRVADGGMRQAHPTVEPRPSAQAPDDRNGNRSYDRRTGHWTRVPVVQNRGTGIVQSLCCLHQSVDGQLLALKIVQAGTVTCNNVLNQSGCTQYL